MAPKGEQQPKTDRWEAEGDSYRGSDRESNCSVLAGFVGHARLLGRGQLLVHGMGFSPDHKTLAIVSIGSNSVTSVETVTYTIKHVTYVGRAPHEAFFTPDGNDERITLRPRSIDITLWGGASDASVGAPDHRTLTESCSESEQASAPRIIEVPWAPRMARARKGVAWVPFAQTILDPVNRNTVLTAIARARSWMHDLVEGRTSSFDDIARRENKVERHIRRLIPLAFLSPRIIDAIAHGSAPADLTVTSLTSALHHSWARR